MAVLSGLGPGVQYAGAAEEAKSPAEMSPEEQNKKALEAFQNILDLSESGERRQILPRLEAAYHDLIGSYPKANLVHEACWRLLQIYINDYQPPAFDKAEKLRAEFYGNYPDSRLKDLIDRTLADGYARHGKWDKVLALFAPSIKQSIESGKFTRVYDIFMYSEAKYKLGDLAEAEKGYRIVTTTFPDTRHGAIAKTRLEEIDKKKPKQQ